MFRANHSLMHVSSTLIFSLSNLQSGAPEFCLKALTLLTSVVSSAYSIALNFSLILSHEEHRWKLVMYWLFRRPVSHIFVYH